MSTDAPEDERAALGFLPPRRENVPLVLQASPLDAKSSGGDEFFYDPFADLEFGDFAAARAFVIVTATSLSSTSAPIPWPSKRCFRWPPSDIFWRSCQACLPRATKFWRLSVTSIAPRLRLPPLPPGLPGLFWISMWQPVLLPRMAVPLLRRRPLSVRLRDWAFSFGFVWGGTRLVYSRRSPSTPRHPSRRASHISVGVAPVKPPNIILCPNLIFLVDVLAIYVNKINPNFHKKIHGKCPFGGVNDPNHGTSDSHWTHICPVLFDILPSYKGFSYTVINSYCNCPPRSLLVLIGIPL